MNYYPNFNNQYYMQDLQNMRDRIDQQMRQMQQQSMQQVPTQPANITQNFQLMPNQISNEIDAKYAKDIEEVKSTLTLKDTFFVDKDIKNLWFKNASGDIKTYTLNEVIELDPKDKEIAELKRQIEEMKGMITNARNVNENVNEPITSKKPTNVPNDKSSNKQQN